VDADKDVALDKILSDEESNAFCSTVYRVVDYFEDEKKGVVFTGKRFSEFCKPLFIVNEQIKLHAYSGRWLIDQLGIYNREGVSDYIYKLAVVSFGYVNDLGRARKRKKLHLSTVDQLKVGFHPWLNIRSARWLKFGSARTQAQTLDR
jgi:hypothetical protein